MAASSGKKRYKSTRLGLFCVCLFFNLLSYCHTLSIPSQPLKLNVPHTAETGFLVIQWTLNETCVDVQHMHRSDSNRPPSNPFTVQRDGSLVIKTSVHDMLGDLFIISPKLSEFCRTSHSVSKLSTLHIEIVHSEKGLHFVKNHYEGSITEYAHAGTKVQGMQQLYACSAVGCSNNLDYRIVGSGAFYLETISKGDHIQLEIYATIQLGQSQNRIHNFMIVAQDSQDLQGHTSIEVRLTPTLYQHIAVPGNDSLYFAPHVIHRNRRATSDTLSVKSVAETAQGNLFSVNPSNSNFKYVLSSSTYQNAFTVSADGTVSVTNGFTLDYESLTDKGGSNSVQLVINVLESSDDSLVKELHQTVTILDENDELPFFSNKPTPFKAAVNIDAQSGTLVYTLTVKDPDAGANVNLEQVPPAAGNQVNNYFQVVIQQNQVEAQVTRRGNQPLTLNQDFKIIFQATDTAAPAGTPQVVTTELVIHVGTVNPQFMKNVYDIKFQEENIPDQLIDTIEVFSFQDNFVTCTVLDDNQAISTTFYTRSVNIPTDPVKECQLYVKKTLNYERAPRTFRVTIKAREDSTRLFTDQVVTISVTDKNEYAPRFGISTYKKDNVKENIAKGNVLILVSAMDEDFNSKVTFSVDNDHFRVEATDPSATQNPHTANIIVNKPLDFDRLIPHNYIFTVKVTDHGVINRFGTAKVQIFMTNVNDEHPIFPDTMMVELRYDTDVGHDVYRVQATDADQGDKVTYEFIETYGKFEIEASTGLIKLRNTIATSQDTIATFQYLLQIRATDDGGCCTGDNTKLSSTGTVTINIQTDNLNIPDFADCGSYNPEVLEEKADILVIKVTAVDPDYGANGDVTYSLREPHPYFRINDSTGDIYTDVAIDREILGASKTITVNVIATDGGNLQGRCSFLVKIKDINDNAPDFVNDEYNVRVLNTLGSGSIAATVEATDADSGTNAEVIYSFSADGNPGGYFKFDDISATGQIKVNKTLPTPGTIILVVEARDKGTPQLLSNATVTVRIISDDSLQQPKWIGSDSDFTVTVPESIDSSYNILAFKAQAYNDIAQINFKVVDDKNIFKTNGDVSGDRIQTGFLSLKPGNNLDYESTESYSFTIRAADAGELLSDRRVTVYVTDTNDNIPIFFGKDENTGWVDLNLLEGDYTNVAPPGKYIGQIRTKDDDKESPNNVISNYTIETSTILFSIDSTGKVYTNKAFDRESIDKYAITVAAFDNAPSAITNDGQPNKGSVGVRILIKDVNDNPPKFQQDSYTFEASEVLDNNDKIPNKDNTFAQVKAIDADSDAVLLYSVSPMLPTDPNPPFSIQSQTGFLTVAGPLDFDRPGGQKYEFIVNVFDSIYSSSTNVTINVINANDNSPNVDNYEFKTFYEEDFSVVGPIATVNVSDIDGDIDGDGIITFFYSLVFTDDNDAQYFKIERHTGVLYIRKPLDRDEPNGKPLFIFTVEVADEDPADKTKTALYGYGIVRVHPIDVNDNAPIFTELTMTVFENQNADTLVGKVTAVDYDDGENGKFDLSIIKQSPQAVFRLDGSDLLTTASLDRETTDRYFVEMKAVDKGNPTQIGYGTLTIIVGDVNDNAPFFNTTYKFFLSEHQKTGEFGRIKAFDKDIGINAVLTYTLDTALTYFKMDQDYATNEGILRIFQDVDYDDIVNLQRSFNLTAYAIDPNPGQNYENRAETFIDVEVTDYNDEVPTFNQPEKSASVREDENVGTLLETFNATDRDVDPDYSHFEYYIERKSDPTRRFIINQRGEVKILNKMDRETTAQHIVHILAIDNINGSPQNTGTATLTVTVTDINDNYPDFAQDYTKTLMENELFKDSTLLTFSAKDADEADNGPPFSFEMICPADGASVQCTKFTLTEDTAGDNGRGTGTIVVNGEFDREYEKIVSLVIRMCDLRGKNRGDQKCGIRFLNVTIGDTNDNIHKDGTQQIVVYNYKGLFKDIEIGSVNANDPDDFDTDKTFTLLDIDVAGKFVLIGREMGKITLKPDVPEMSFEVRVEVKDQKLLTTTSTVLIEVKFVTDDAVYSSGSVRIDGISPEDFLYKPKIEVGYGPSMLEKFKEHLARKLYSNSNNNNNNNKNIKVNQSDLDKVLMFSVMGNESHTDLRFAAHGSPWYQSSRLDGIVTTSRDEFEPLLKTDGIRNVGKINMVPIDMCRYETCEGGCFNKLVVENTAKMYNTKGSSYVGVDTRVEGTCGCRAKLFAPVIKCTPGYCYHGGECVKDDWGNVRCDCPEGFDGHRCQKLRQSFDGTGYALYKQLEQCEESRTSIEIMTKFDTALILYMGPIAKLLPTDPTDFLLLELVNGRPRLRINHGTGEIKIEVAGGKSLSDGMWHRIDIYRDKKYVRLVVDHCVDSTDRSDCEGTGVTRGENIYLNAASVLQLGGRMSSPTYPSDVITEKFNGCMKNLIHNAEVYDLSTGGQFPGAKDGCDAEDDACKSGCAHGQCLITGVGEQHKCVCNDGYKITTPSGRCDTETTVRMLETQGFIDWQIKNSFLALLSSRTMTIRFQFRTRDSDGLIFLVSDRDSIHKYISLKIVSRQLQLSYNLGSDGYTLPLLNVPDVSNGQWHSVTLERYGKQFILKMDSGEGRYYADTLGPMNGAVDFNVRPDQVYGGASVSYSSGNVVFVAEDFENSCLNDIRFDNDWFPMTDEEETQSPVALVETVKNSKLGCDWNVCSDTKCRAPFECLNLWGHFECVCQEYYIKSGETCVPIDPCGPSPCFGDSICNINVPPTNGEELFKCRCIGQWYGSLCQCHPFLNPGGTACEKENEQEPQVGIAAGLIIGVMLGILFLIAAVIILVWLFIFRTKPAEKEPFDEDMEDDIIENIMYYDEEGAGEEDNTQYDLSRLRKPDTGEHPSTWDAPDVRKVTKPLGTSADRPEVGNFINTRLNDADDDPNSPPYDTPIDFNMEGGSSDAGSLSSLNTSSSGSQDYDYLNEWGPKFAKLADMYNNYDDAE